MLHRPLLSDQLASRYFQSNGGNANSVGNYDNYLGYFGFVGTTTAYLDTELRQLFGRVGYSTTLVNS